MIKQLYPVLHMDGTMEQLERNLTLCAQIGVDGVFLIDHHGSYKRVLSGAILANAYAPGMWIGVNLLDLDAEQSFFMIDEYNQECGPDVSTIKGLWVDDMGIVDESETINDDVAMSICKTEIKLGLPVDKYFGSVAFKYQKPVVNLIEVTDRATQVADVVVTSGEGTGKAADINKIITMADVCHNNKVPLAIASGITPENVVDYKTADIFMVATGISKSFHEFDGDKMKMLLDRVKNL